jgi:hypothetical protein
LPLLVRFRDISDPKTVEKVDPANLAASFGAGVKLTRATIETVPSGYWPFNLFGIGGSPVTRGIEARLPWWKDRPNKSFDELVPQDGTLASRQRREFVITVYSGMQRK